MGETCLMGCSKMLLVFINFLLFITGLVLLGVGVYSLWAMDLPLENMISLPKMPAVITIVIGACIIILAFFGCSGAFFENRCILITFALLLSVLILLLTATGVASFIVMKPLEKESVKIGSTLERFIPLYEKRDPKDSTARRGETRAWDMVQSSLKCCGFHDGPQDWAKNEGLDLSKSVPDSCCIKSTKQCGRGQLNAKSEAIFQRPCEPVLTKLLSYLPLAMVIIGSTALVFAVLYLLALIITSCMAHSIKKSQLTVEAHSMDSFNHTTPSAPADMNSGMQSGNRLHHVIVGQPMKPQY